jgi:hypothetical protein
MKEMDRVGFEPTTSTITFYFVSAGMLQIKIIQKTQDASKHSFS